MPGAAGPRIGLVAATAADWPRAWAIQREAFAELVTRTSGGWTPALEAECARAWAHGRTRLVEVDGAVVGWVRRERHVDHDWLDLVVLGAGHRGRGLGTAVIRLLQAEAAEKGVPLWLSVHRANAARQLYARLGFVEVERDERRVFAGWSDPIGLTAAGPPSRPPRSPPR